jgi:hypothetical protein
MRPICLRADEVATASMETKTLIRQCTARRGNQFFVDVGHELFERTVSLEKPLDALLFFNCTIKALAEQMRSGVGNPQSATIRQRVGADDRPFNQIS